eukprot:2595798-Rhodomonas_salina.6
MIARVPQSLVLSGTAAAACLSFLVRDKYDSIQSQVKKTEREREKKKKKNRAIVKDTEKQKLSVTEKENRTSERKRDLARLGLHIDGHTSLAAFCFTRLIAREREERGEREKDRGERARGSTIR